MAEWPDEYVECTLIRAAPSADPKAPALPKPVAWIEREAMDALRRDKRASTTVSSGLLARPFGDKRALYAADQLLDALEGARKVIEGAREVLANYADPTSYTDGFGEPLTSDADTHPGLLAQEARDICTEWLAANPKEVQGNG